MRVKMTGTSTIELIAETLEDGVLLERLRRKYCPNEPDPAWPGPVPGEGMPLARWMAAQIKAGRNPLLLSWPIRI